MSNLLQQADFLAELEDSIEEIKKQRESLAQQEAYLKEQYEEKRKAYENQKASLSDPDPKDPNRKLLNRVVRNLASSVFDGDFRAAYAAVYRSLWASKGWHPASEIEKHTDTMLDYVQRHGLLPEAIQIAQQLFALSGKK